MSADPQTAVEESAADTRARKTALSNVQRVHALPLGCGCNFNTGAVVGANSRAWSSQPSALAGLEETFKPPWLVDIGTGAPSNSPGQAPAPSSFQGDGQQLACNKSFSSTNSSSQFSKYFSLDAGGSISIGGLAGASVTYHEVESFASQSNSEFYSYSAEVTTAWRSIKDPSNLRLTDEAAQLYRKDVDSFTRTYGTHFLAAIPTVHRFQAALRVTHYAEQYLHSESITVEVHVLFWSFSFTIDLLFEQHSTDSVKISLLVKDTITGAEISRDIDEPKSTLEQIMPEFVQALREETSVFTEDQLTGIVSGNIGHSLDVLYRDYSFYAAKATTESIIPSLAGAVWLPYEVVLEPGAEQAKTGDDFVLGPSVVSTLHEYAQVTRILIKRIESTMGEPPAVEFTQDKQSQGGSTAPGTDPSKPDGGQVPIPINTPEPLHPQIRPPRFGPHTPGLPRQPSNGLAIPLQGGNSDAPPSTLPPGVVPHIAGGPAPRVLRPPFGHLPRLPQPHIVPAPNPVPDPPPPPPPPPQPQPPTIEDPFLPPTGPTPASASGAAQPDTSFHFDFLTPSSTTAQQDKPKPTKKQPPTVTVLDLPIAIPVEDKDKDKNKDSLGTIRDSLNKLYGLLLSRQRVLEKKDQQLRSNEITVEALGRFLQDDLELIAELFRGIPYALAFTLSNDTF